MTKRLYRNSCRNKFFCSNKACSKKTTSSVRNRVTKVTMRITGVRWALSFLFLQKCAGSNPARDKGFLVISVGIAVTA